jgi:signal transduction histidine kinase
MPPPWLHRPRRTARLRFTAIYSGLFLLSGIVLIAVTYGLFQQATRYTRPHLPPIPRTPAIQPVQLPRLSAGGFVAGAPSPKGVSQLPQDLSLLAEDNQRLSQVQQLLNQPLAPGNGPALGLPVSHLAGDQQQLAQDQHQLAAAVNQLAQAEHQVALAGSVEAAQRASDSHQLLVNSAIALAVVAVLALILGWFVAARMLRPVRTITATARRISASNLRERLALDHADEEFKRLGDTLDELFARLAAAFEAQRHFVANASHELRTPLTAERNLLQVALDDPNTSAETWRDTAHELLSSNDEQKNLIEALLALATSESGLDHQEPADLAEICASVLSRPGLDTDSLALQVETAIHSAPVDGDPTLIERLVRNLVDNAIGHNIPGGHLQISTGTTDGQAVLTVTNTGPVIPPGEIDRLFQPFQRLDSRRTHYQDGHGLGLSIVQAIAATHHASITAYPLPGGGLTLTVTFPPPTSASARPSPTSPTRALATSRV